jgi:hypothetical protein
MEIRKATIFDFSSICALLFNMHKEVDFEISPINPTKFSVVILNGINQGVFLVAIENGKIIGSIGGGYSSEWWSDEIMLGDAWFYVEPESRKTHAAKNLIKEFMELGDGMKIKLGHMYGVDQERKNDFYERLGLKKAGIHYFSEAS